MTKYYTQKYPILKFKKYETRFEQNFNSKRFLYENAYYLVKIKLSCYD